MPQYWLRENGLPEQSGQDLADPDRDGFNNYAEYMAGSNPNDAQDFFRIEIGRTSDDKPVLRWKRENYRAYTVLKSDDLSSASSFTACTNVAAATLVDSASAKSEILVNSEELQGPTFYKVAIQQQ